MDHYILASFIGVPLPNTQMDDHSLGDTIVTGVGVAFVAFLIWLAVRIINRREKWAKRLAWGVAAAVMVYPLGYGPATWVFWQTWCPKWLENGIFWFYRPCIWLAESGPEPIQDCLAWYLDLWV